ncbi:MAG: SGNH/GDSL hydrolase family protein [Bacteroidales bacterium]|nr:SGNH/GDSL hydrolase family protein [Bacteroidales bacterium]
MKHLRVLVLFAVIALVAGCTAKEKKQTIALFGGSFSVIAASDIATDYWADQLNAKITKYGVGGAGFSNKTQWDGQHIQWQVDSACAPEAPVYDTYILWASTNDFNQVNELSGDPWDYTEFDGFDETKLETQCGGINYAIKRIREKAPKAKILFMTSTKCFTRIGAGTNPAYSGEETGMNEFVAKQILCCQIAGVPYLDQFMLPPFNESNFAEYCESDNLHLNEKGYEALRDLQVKFIKGGETIRGGQILLAGHSDYDCANYGAYAGSNAATAEDPEVVLFGDSITYNWARFHPEWLAEHNFAGRGISGQTTIQALARFRRDVVDLHPKYVAILYGTNDVAENLGNITLEDVAGNIASMAEIAQANGITPVLCTLVPAARYGWRPQLGEQSRNVVALNKLIRNIAAQKNLLLCDYWTAMNNGQGGLSAELSGDGVHPYPDAYNIMEAELLKTLGMD